MGTLARILAQLDREGATEVVIASGRPVALRVNGKFQNITSASVSLGQMVQILGDSALAELWPREDGTGTPVDVDLGRPVRAQFIKQGADMIIRIVPRKPRAARKTTTSPAAPSATAAPQTRKTTGALPATRTRTGAIATQPARTRTGAIATQPAARTRTGAIPTTPAARARTGATATPRTRGTTSAPQPRGASATPRPVSARTASKTSTPRTRSKSIAASARPAGGASPARPAGTEASATEPSARRADNASPARPADNTASARPASTPGGRARPLLPLDARPVDALPASEPPYAQRWAPARVARAYGRPASEPGAPIGRIEPQPVEPVRAPAAPEASASEAVWSSRDVPRFAPGAVVAWEEALSDAVTDPDSVAFDDDNRPRRDARPSADARLFFSDASRDHGVQAGERPPGVVEATAATPGLVDDEAVVTAELEKLVAVAVRRAATDLLVGAERTAFARVRGELVALDGGVLAAGAVDAMLMPLLGATRRRQLAARGYVDLAATVGGRRLRGNIARQQGGLKGAFRIAMATPPTLAQLGLPEDLEKITAHHQGLVVVAGPSGHGKTTTMAALVDRLNATRPIHILAVEDPVEIEHPKKVAVVSQREVGRHTLGFATALKAALRQDPDVIVIGELRDRETVAIALAAAETGHLVIATMSTPSAAKTIDRLIDMFAPDEQNQVRVSLAGALRAIVAQRIVPAIDGGVAPAVELVTGVLPLATLIRDNKLYQLPSLQQRGRAFGMIRLDESLAELVRAGRVAEDVAVQVAESKRDLLATLHPPPAMSQSMKRSGLFGRKLGE